MRTRDLRSRAPAPVPGSIRARARANSWSRMTSSRRRHRHLHELLEHAAIDVIELSDVQAALAGLVLAEPGPQMLVVHVRSDIDDEVGFARREPQQRRIALVAR